MELTADDLSRALAVCCGEEPDGPAEAVALVRRHEPSLAPTLYSAWQAEGAELPPPLRYELDVARARTQFFRSLASSLIPLVPGLFSVKGIEVADLYPDGFARAMNDVDLVAPDESDLWPAVAALVDDGWQLHTATFTRFDGSLQIMVSLRRPHEDPYVLPYGVEVATYAALGNLGGVPPLRLLPADWRVPAVKNALMLLYERFEQPYRARDLIDATLLLGRASAAEVATFRQAVARLGLHPEYAELVRLVDAAELAPLPAPALAARAAPRIPVRRAVRGAGLLRSPLHGTARHLQRRLISGKSASVERRVWQAASRRLDVAAAVRSGLLAFGLPLETPAPAVASATLRERGDLVWMDTPVARFMLTIGDEVTEEAVTALSQPETAAAAAPQDPGTAAVAASPAEPAR